MAAHRYWRLNITALNGRVYAGCGEMEMLTAAGGSDVCSGGTPIASSEFWGAATNAFDNNPTGSFWASSNAALPEYIGYDFGAGNDKDIVGFTYQPRNDSFANSDAPNAGDFQYSDDGSSWTTLFSISGQTSWGQTEKRVFLDPALPLDVTVTTSNGNRVRGGDTVTARRFWRVYVTAVNGKSDGSVGFREIQLRESIGGSDVTGSGTASADSFFSGGVEADKAFDNNTGTEWASGTGGLPHWIAYDFGVGVEKDIRELVWRPRGDTDQHPVDFDLQSSDDGNSWETTIKVRGYVDQNGTTDYAVSENTGIMAETTAYKQAWRVVPTSATGAVYSFGEIQMRATVGGADQCSGGAAYGSTRFGTNYHSAAYDDNTATFGSTGVKTGTQWFGYRFASAVEVREFALTNRADADATQTPTAFTLDYWDGTAWVTARTVTGESAWLTTGSETRTYTLPAAQTSNAQTVTAAAAAVGPGAHRYWRLKITATQGGISTTSCGELELRTSQGGSDVTGSGTAIASTVYGGGLEADKAFDNNQATCWVCGFGAGMPQYIGYDFGAGNDVQIMEVGYKRRDDSFGISESMSTGTVDYSDDGSSWTTAWSIPAQAPFASGENRLFAHPSYPVDCTVTTSNAQTVASGEPNTSHQYWRVKTTETQNPTVTACSFGELEFRATPGGADQANGGTAINSTTLGAPYTASAGFDNNVSTWWVSGGGTSRPEWLGYNFGTPVEVAEVVIKARNDGFGAAETLKNGTVDWSDDGSTWTTFYTFPTQATWSSGEVRTYTIVNDATATTSSASTVDADAEVTSADATATSNASTVAATAGVSSDATVATSSASTTDADAEVEGVATGTAQSVAAEAGVSLDVAATTSQAQSAAATGTISLDAAATTSQAQTVAAAAAAATPWAYVGEVRKLGVANPDTLAAFNLVDGNHVVLHVAYSVVGSNSGTCAVTDTAGNIYTEVGEAVDTASINMRTKSFVALNCTGHATNVITVEVTGASSAVGGMDMLAQQFSSPSGAELDVFEGKVSTSSSTTTITDLFTPSATGALSASARVLSGGGAGSFSTAGWTNNDNGNWESAYRIGSSGSAQTLTYTSGGNSYRVLTVVGLREISEYTETANASTVAAVVGVSVDTTVSTSSATTAAAFGPIDSAVESSSASASASVVGVSLDVVSATAGASAATGELALSSDGAAASSSASTSAAVVGVSADSSATTSGVSSAVAAAGVSSTVQTATQTAQTAAGATNVASETQGSTASAQSLAAVGLTISFLSGGTSSTSTTTGATAGVISFVVVSGSTPGSVAAVAGVSMAIQEVATHTASKALALAEIELENGVTTRNAQSVQAEVGVSVDMSVSTSQLTTAAAQAGVAVDMSVTTSSAQSAAAVTLGEWLLNVATANAQVAAAEALAQTTSSVTTAQAQGAAAEAGVSVDMSVATGSFSYIAYARVDVAHDSQVTTSSTSSTLLAVASVDDTPEPYFITCDLSVFPAVAGGVELKPAVAGGQRIIPAVAGDADVRPL